MPNQIASENKTLYNTICVQILDLDSSIRFAGFCNKMGTILAAEYRNGMAKLLTEKESKLSYMDSVLRMTTRYGTQPKLGKSIYSFTVYQNVRRATALIDNKDNSTILMVSFDNKTEVDYESIMLHGILPLVYYYLNVSKGVLQTNTEI
jgi:hypothetical protein